ncbi:MAG: hypothetical protein QW097_00120 [archaeon]
MHGISEVISYVLVIAIIVTLTMTAYYWAVPSVIGLGEGAKVQTLWNQMKALDSFIQETAHGDIGFKQTFHFQMPKDSFIKIDENLSGILFFFRQESGIVGFVNITGGNCSNESEDIIFEPMFKLNLAREDNFSRVFKGSSGPGPGIVEFLICYPDIEIKWSGGCSSVSSSPTTLINAKKVNYSTKPVVELEVCG